MIYKNELVNNFARDVSWIKKILINIWYKFGSLAVGKKKNALVETDKSDAKKILKKGDIILVGALRRMHSIYIGGIFTHALLYIGSGNCIHAIAHGVCAVSLDEIFEEYDSMAIVRHSDATSAKIEKSITYAKKQIGKPFDFHFTNDDEKLYCTELLYKALHHGGLKFNMRDKDRHIQLINEIIHPMHLLQGSLKQVFLSRNLEIKHGKISVKKMPISRGMTNLIIKAAKFISKCLKRIRGLPHFSNE